MSTMSALMKILEQKEHQFLEDTAGPDEVLAQAPESAPAAPTPSPRPANAPGLPGWAGRLTLVFYDAETCEKFPVHKFDHPWACWVCKFVLPPHAAAAGNRLASLKSQHSTDTVVLWPRPGLEGKARALSDAAELAALGVPAIGIADLPDGPVITMADQQKQIVQHALAGAIFRAYPLRAQGTAIAVLPSTAPPDLFATFKAMRALITRYVAFNSIELDAVAFWCLQTWVHGEFEVAPRLIFQSSDPRADSSRVLRVLSWLTPNPCLISHARASSLVSLIARERPTLLLDDRASAMCCHRDMRALLAAGAHRDGIAAAARGAQPGPTLTSCFAPLAAATSLVLPQEILTHAIVIPMSPPLMHDEVVRLSVAAPPPAALALRAEIHNGILKFLEGQHERVWPELSIAVTAREAWEPIFVLAKYMGLEAEEAAKNAANSLTVDQCRLTEGSDLKLLADVRLVLGGTIDKAVPSATIIGMLTFGSESYWRNCEHGKPLSPRSLAQKFARFGLRAATVRVSSSLTVRGFKGEDLLEAFARYLDDQNAGAIFRDQIKERYRKRSPEELEALDARGKEILNRAPLLDPPPGNVMDPCRNVTPV